MRIFIVTLVLCGVYMRSPWQHQRYLHRREVLRQKIEYNKMHKDEIDDFKFHEKMRRLFKMPKEPK